MCNKESFILYGTRETNFHLHKTKTYRLAPIPNKCIYINNRFGLLKTMFQIAKQLVECIFNIISCQNAYFGNHKHYKILVKRVGLSTVNNKCNFILTPNSGPEVIKLFPCSTQLSTKFILLINVKMPTIVGILTFMSRINTTSERLNAINFFICRYFSFYEQLKFRAQLS